MDDDSFRQILDRLGLSWKGYARVRKGVKKRICRHMQEHGCQTLDDYLLAIDNPEILTAVKCLFCVSISRFFRDRLLWEILETEIMPAMIGKYDERINVWSAGCAMGQEVYSFAMLWDILKGRYDRLPQLFLCASDSNPDYLERARGGAYRISSLKGLPDEKRATYFHISADRLHYLVVDSLKKDITWHLLDVMRQPPPAEKFQIIFLRNSVLTYYREEHRTPVLQKILESLEDGGFLIIGCHERLPSQIRVCSPHKSCPYIFQKT